MSNGNTLMIQKTCKWCGAAFYLSAASKAQYCSNECRRMRQREAGAEGARVATERIAQWKAQAQ